MPPARVVGACHSGGARKHGVAPGLWALRRAGANEIDVGKCADRQTLQELKLIGTTTIIPQLDKAAVNRVLSKTAPWILT